MPYPRRRLAVRVSPISLLSIALLISTSILSGCEDPAVANKPSLPGIDATPSPIFPEPSSPALIRDVALNAPVEIIHDEHDIPHIFAKSDRDLFFASGYQVATDRLFTLDINRRKATGRLAEVFGEGGVSNDIQANVLGFTKWARPSLEAMAKERPGDYELLLAYTSGINRRVAEVLADPALTPEGFERNDYSPEPFSPEDLLSIGIRIQFGYSSTLEFDLLTTFLARTQPAAFKELAIFQPGANAFTMVWGTSFASALQPSIPSPLDRLPQEPLEPRPDELQELIDGMRRFRYNLRVGEGSNGWSVHGDHTFNGKPIVANDSHSGLSDPNDLYLMHLNSAEAGGDFDVMGYAFIGVPGIHLGHNDKLTWAATTHFADMTDLWDVRLDREALTAELGGFTATLDQRTITYKVRGEDGKLEERELVVEEVPGYGVILPDELLPVPSGLLARGSLMLGWPGWEPNTELFMFLDFDRATTLDDFKRAIDRQRVGMQNWQAATASGHVYYTNGNVPDRGPLETRGTPNMIMDGKNPDHLWLRGYLPKSRIPKLDGTQPFLMTANNDPWGHTADNDPLNDEFYYGSFYAPGFRAAELRDRLTELTERGDITREEMQALQLDQRSLIADGLIPHLRDAVDNLVRYGEEPAGSVAEVDERALERAPLVAGHPKLLRGRAVDVLGNPHHRRVVFRRVTPRHVRAHVAVEAILADEVDAVLRRPVAFLVAGEKRAVAIHRHAVGRAEAIGNAPALGAVLAHLDDGSVMRHQPVLGMARGLGKIKIALRIRLQIHRELVEMLSHLMVVVEALIKIHLAIIVDVVQPGDLVAATNVNRLVDNLQPERLEHPRRHAPPSEIALRQIKPLHNPHISLPSANRRAPVVLEKIKATEAHPRLPRVLIRQLKRIRRIRPRRQARLDVRLHRLLPLRRPAAGKLQ